MTRIRVAVAAVNQTPLDWTGNAARIRAAIAEARVAGASVLCLPELCITGYGCEDAFHGAWVAERALAQLAALAPVTAGMAVTLGLPVLWRNQAYNAVAVCVDGQVAALIPKQHLAGDGVHYEPRWFRAWPAGARVGFDHGGVACPMGDLVVDCGGVRLGLEICEDAWVPDRAAARMAARGLDILVNPSASHFAFAKTDVRRRIVCEGSRAASCVYLFGNLLGNEAGRVIYDGEALIASQGRIVAAGPRFSFRDQVVTTAAVELGRNRLAQRRTTSFPRDPAEPADATVTLAWCPPAATGGEATTEPPAWERSPHRKEEEFARAVALALADYLRKSHSRGLVLSLSGGADSAAVACLTRIMLDLGARELGSEAAMLARLGLSGEPATRLLTTVYQATANSSQVTREAAATVARLCRASHHALDVDGLAAAYTGLAAQVLGRTPGWANDDLAMQNIQARVRGPSVWMVANCLNALLVTTSNRTEAAVGYATMDGDTCGGLAPIAGIDKAFLRHWLAWLETHGVDGLGPWPELSCITQQRSTPELRPATQQQKSEEDLMPFAVLDAIERLAIRDKLSPQEVVDRLAERHPERPRDTIIAWVRRFFQLWSRNQWKRERYAPSFHLDDENLDPKTWCRFPILSGGFSEDLGGLR